MDVRLRAPVRAFTSLDAINLTDLFEHRARLMQSVPHILRGAFRMALSVACQEILDGMEANSEVRTVRGWKLFLVLPRMMLFRPDRGGPVSRKKLEARFWQFQEGDWISLCVRVLLLIVPVSDVVAVVQMRRPSGQRVPCLWCGWESPAGICARYPRHAGDAHRPDSKTPSAKKF